MANARPVVLLDPYPRNNGMIFSHQQRERLQAMADVVTVESGPLPDAVIDAALPRVTAVLGQTALPRERLDRAPHLKAILNVEGNFFPNIDYTHCFARGIRIACVSPVFAQPVAEYALALTLDLVRGITVGDRAMREGREQYGWRGNVGYSSLFGADVGIIGFGNIARALMPLLAPFRCRVRAFDPWLPAASLREFGAEATDLEAVLTLSRVVIVLAAPTAQNRQFIGATELACLPVGCKLIVLSRADVVDFEALNAEMRRGRIEVATDVFPEEPLPLKDPLRGMTGVLLSSHRAGGLDAALKAIGEMAIDDLSLILRGLPPVRMQSAQPETVAMQRSKPGLMAK